MLHVQHSARLSLLLAAALTACRAPGPVPRPTAADVPTTRIASPTPDNPPPSVVATPDTGAVPSPAQPEPIPSEPSPWWAAWDDTPLSDADEDQLLRRLSDPVEDVRRAAAMALARRGAAARVEATRLLIPPALRVDYLRALHARPRDRLPPGWTGLREYTDAFETRRLVLSLSARLGIPLTPNSRDWPVGLLASARPDDQRVGARLIAQRDATLPSPGIVLGVSAPVAAVLARSLATRPDLSPQNADTILAAWLERAQLQPRDWAVPILAFAQHLTDVSRAPPGLRAALTSLQAVPLDDNRVRSRFRCRVAVQRVRFGDVGAVTGCGLDPNDGFEAIAAVEASRAVPPADRIGLYRALLGTHALQPRVLIAVAEQLGELTPAQALPLVRALAAVGDPGVTAALLDALMLHVQHFRALRAAEQRALLDRVLAANELDFLEARVTALRLARAAGVTVEAPASTIRAVRRAASPDAGLETRPAPSALALAGIAHRLVVETTAGRVVIDTGDSTAPASVATVLEAVRQRLYDGTRMHRVVPGFVAQGGDPRGDGYGGTIRVTPTEVSGRAFVRGAVGAALAGLDTGGMQWFVVLGDAPHLDARYPYLGRVVEGMDVVDRWMEEDTITRITAE